MAKHDDGESPEADGASARTHGRQRVAKLMARAGLCSRRDAEAWVADGRVALNGVVLSSPAVDVGLGDVVLVDGLPLPDAEKTRLFLFHKPRGLVTSDHDPEGRPTVADHLRAAWPEGPRVVTVGRLDINTEGLLLLTNDGGLARVLELPRTGWVRRYRVRAKGQTDQGVLDGLREGVTIEGVDYVGIEARLDRVQGSNCWLTMGLREGKNREVKRVLEHVGLEVNRLIRLSFGPFQLGDLPDGAVAEVKTRILRDQLGEALAAQAGVDFHEEEAPVVPAASSEAVSRSATGTDTKARGADFKARGADTKARGADFKARGADTKARGADFKARGAAQGRRSAPPPRAGRAASPFKPAGNGRRAREGDDEQPAKRERPATGPRKHVSLLRAAPAGEEPRKRVERTSTRDKADRPILVERLETAARSRAKPDAKRPGGVRLDSADAFNPAGSRPSTSKAGAARARALASARHDDERGTRQGVPSRHGAGASLSALGKRERVMRSGGASRDGPSRDVEPRRAARPADQKRQRDGAELRQRTGRKTAGDDRRPTPAHRAARTRPDATMRPSEHRARPSSGGGDRAPAQRPSPARPFRTADRSGTRERAGGERHGRPPRSEGAGRSATARRDGEPPGGKKPRVERRPTSGRRADGTAAPGAGPRGRSDRAKPNGRNKPGGGKPGGRPAGGAKR